MLEKIKIGLGGSVVGICILDFISTAKNIHYIGAFLGFILAILIVCENKS